MIKILVKAYNKETCHTVERIYPVDSISEYVTKVRPAMLKAWAISGNLELLDEYVKVKF